MCAYLFALPLLVRIRNPEYLVEVLYHHTMDDLITLGLQLLGDGLVAE